MNKSEITTEAEWAEIRRLHLKDGVPHKELARRFKRDIKTIRRLIEREVPPRKRRLDAFQKEIAALLRASGGRVTAKEVSAHLEPNAGPISERTVRKYLADFKERLMDETRPEELAEETTVAESAAPPPDVSGPDCLLNRELTWLGFQDRVLSEAEDERTPLLERLKFISIVGSNLDEFFMKRIGGLKQQVGAGLTERSVDGRTPAEQIEECLAATRDLELRKRHTFKQVRAQMEQEGLCIAEWEDLTDEERQQLRDHYFTNIYPLVTPQATDPAHPFPFISNLAINLLVGLRHPKEQQISLARVKVPVGVGLPRMLKVPGRDAWVRMELVLGHNLDLLFPGMTIEMVATFRVTRNANTEADEEKAEDLMQMIESELRERRFAPVVRLEVSRNMPQYYKEMLAAELGLDAGTDVFEVHGMLGMRDLMELTAVDRPDLCDPHHHPIDHPLLTTDRNIFHVIRDEGPMLLHHPYQSFTTSVERFIREASRDPKVRAIKMTLYRTSTSSKAIPHLIEAARNGKQVAVVVELKARFDEAANIRWASRMEEAGIHVTYGVVGLKTHCKVILVVRQDYSGLRRYAHVGTGNYHAGTARLYSDLGILTCDPQLGADLTELLNYLTTGYRPKRHYDKILVAPKVLKQALLEKIAREAELHSEESPGLIRMKCNALEDADITRALYTASQKGVKVQLIVRDTCRLRPGVPGLSENVEVISLVGRFLEHARLYYFRNGGNGNEEYYMGSADAMKRNLESRVEFLAPIEHEGLKEQLQMFLELQINDQRSAWDMQPDGSYVQRKPETEEQGTGAQEAMIEWAAKELKKATRLRRRQPKGITRRNIRG